MKLSPSRWHLRSLQFSAVLLLGATFAWSQAELNQMFAMGEATSGPPCDVMNKFHPPLAGGSFFARRAVIVAQSSD